MTFMKTSKKNYLSYNKHIYKYRSRTSWSFMKFYFVHIVRICFVFKKHSLWLYSSVYENEREEVNERNEGDEKEQ